MVIPELLYSRFCLLKRVVFNRLLACHSSFGKKDFLCKLNVYGNRNKKGHSVFLSDALFVTGTVGTRL